MNIVDLTADNVNPTNANPTTNQTIQVNDEIRSNLLKLYKTHSKKTSRNPKAKLATSTVGSSNTSVNNIGNVNDVIDDEEEKFQLFQIKSQIVGKRYYAGSMNPGEIVYLVREPRNPYDSNAIKVESLSRMQVGHIEAKNGTAGCLAPIADYRLAGKAGGDLEGVVGRGGKFSSECIITIVGMMSHKEEILKHLKSRRLPFMDIATGESFYGFSNIVTPQKLKESTSSRENYQKLSEDELIKQLDDIWDTQERDQASGILAELDISLIRDGLADDTVLFEHQKQGITWMIKREKECGLPPFYTEKQSSTGSTSYFHSILCHNYSTQPSPTRGGILCYDMGLGKSLMVLSLILANSNQSASTIKCPPTLIVCPLSVVSSWEDQIRNHTREGKIKAYTYYGKNKSGDEDFIFAHNVVITTYETLVSEFEDSMTSTKKRKAESGSLLFSMNWHRVVLDESHIIRNMKTLKFKSCQAISATLRWCLTGTPIQNGVKDIHAAIQFLRVEPFFSDKTLYDRYFTREIEGKHRNEEGFARLRTLVKQVALRRDKREVLSHNIPPKTEMNVKIKLSDEERDAYEAIMDAISDFIHDISDGDDGLMRNSTAVLGLITRLRQCCLDFSLVPAQALVNLLSNYKKKTSEEDKITGKGSSNISTAERLSKSVQEELLTQLQGMFAKALNTSVTSLGGISNEEDVLECCVCLNPLSEEAAMIFVKCKHAMCDICVEQMFKVARHGSLPCPLCRVPVTRRDCIYFKDLNANAAKVADEKEKPQSSSSSSSNEMKRSSKTTEILKAVIEILRNHPSEKIVIFCSFTSYLDVLQRELKKEKIEICRIDGTVTQANRALEIRKFTNDDSYSVMLCSVKAAGVGITLTRANHVFLADLWWAPAVDLQAIDRIHRLGQSRPVEVLRFIVEESIDDRIFDLQKKKMETARMTMEKDVNKARAERVSDIKKLLSR